MSATISRLCPLARIAGLLLLAGVGCRTASEPIVQREHGSPSVVSADLGSMHNVSLSGALWIGSCPTPGDLDLAARRGIAAAIDLTTPAERPTWDVAATCARHAIEYVSIGIENRERIRDEHVDRALGALRAHAGRPALLFCAHGDRAAMFFAIHRALDDGLAIEQALVEARRAGMKPGHPEVFVRRQVERLAAETTGARTQTAEGVSADIDSTIAVQ